MDERTARRPDTATRTYGLQDLDGPRVGMPAPPPRNIRSQETVVAAGLIAGAGALAVLSSVLHWAEFTFPQTPGHPVTVSAGHAGVALWLGGFLILRGVLTFSLKDPKARRAWGMFAFIGAAIIGGYALYDLATERSHAVALLAQNTADRLGLPVEQVRAIINGQVALGQVRLEFKPGIYLAVFAAALALVGAIMAARQDR